MTRPKSAILAASWFVLGVACSGDARNVSSPATPTGPLPVAELPAGEGQPPVLALAHKWARGFLTVVEVRATARGYQLSSRRFFCSEGENTEIVDDASRAVLSRVLTLLDPTTLSESDPCAKSVRDGTVWVVSKSAADPNKRARLYRMDGDPSCAPFQEAAHSLMKLGNLTCYGTGCYRPSELATQRRSCP